ncbi:TPA: hypothetical protein ACSP88_002526 [Aeromonas hydrophila]
MTDTVQSTAANIAADIQHQGANEYHIISNPRELAAISQAARAGGFYDARFEDNLARSLKHSIANHGYKRVSLPTNPPASIMTALRSRV